VVYGNDGYETVATAMESQNRVEEEGKFIYRGPRERVDISKVKRQTPLRNSRGRQSAEVLVKTRVRWQRGGVN